jgi:elongation of very long chain fatty acids protein 6
MKCNIVIGVAGLLILTCCVLSFVFRIEKKFDPSYALAWMQQHFWIPIVACVLYGAAIIAGQAYFANNPRWHWKYTLASWNSALSVFSTVGMLRTLPQLIHNIQNLSLRDNLCADPRSTYGSGSTGLWMLLFVLSKFP